MPNIEITEDAYTILDEQKCEEAPTESDVIIGMHVMLNVLTEKYLKLKSSLENPNA